MTDSSPFRAEKITVGHSALDRRIRRHVAGRVREYYAITAPGFEEYCRQELADLGIAPGGLCVEAGGVAFAGRFVECQRANLHLRTATRILMRIDAFTATNLRRLERKAGDIAWELFLPYGCLPEIKVRCHRSRLYHTKAIARRIQNSITQRWRGTGASPPSGLPQTLFVRAVNDRFTISLDSSGAPLYKRGLKAGPARAPIRETLAAAILMASGYDPKRPLVDPLCGSGTFSLEAAMMAKQMAPGAQRAFAFTDWPAFGQAQWAFLLNQARSRLRVLPRPRIFASDLDANACGRLADTVAGNRLADAVTVAQKDLFLCGAEQLQGGPGLVAINPPYGIRIGSARQADDLFGRICRHLKAAFGGWDVALIAPHRDLLRRLPFAARQVPFTHGGVPLTLVLGTIK